MVPIGVLMPTRWCMWLSAAVPRCCGCLRWLRPPAVTLGRALGGTQEVVVPGSGDGDGSRWGHRGRDRGHGTAAPGECRGCHQRGVTCAPSWEPPCWGS